MLTQTLAALVVATTLVACGDRTPQIINVPGPEADKPGQMTITGTATLEVSPDCADLTMTISADGERPGIATAGVQAKQQQLVAALAKLGVENADLKLSTTSLNPVYETTLQGYPTGKVRAYRADVTVTVTTHKFDQISAIMEAGGDAGASSMSSAFRRSDLAEMKKHVREMALTAAQDKANQTATALKIKLGRIISVGESTGGAMWGNSYFPQVANSVEARNSGGALGGTMQPLTLDVTIGYELARTL